ncbi:MAG: ABC transporter permease, partial [Gemmatimonadota bacterium]
MTRRRRSIQIPLTTRDRVTRDVDEELRVHFSMRVEELMRGGLSREDAERQAHAHFGDVAAARQALVDEDMLRVATHRKQLGLESWAQDLRYAWRQLVRQPVFTAVALLTLALGTGVTMAIFAVVDGVLLRPLPYENSSELVRLFTQVRGNRRSFSVPDFYDYRDQSRTLRNLATYYDATTNYVNTGAPVRLVATRISDNFFGTLGVAPLLGRTFAPGEDLPSAPRVAVLNEGLWRNTFGADSAIVGRVMQLDGHATEVVGVVRAEHVYPPGTDLWLPTRFTDEDRSPEQRGARYLRVIGRLAPEATLGAAQTEVTGIATRLAQLDSANNRNVGATVIPLQESLVGSLQKPLLTLLIAVAFVLLIATVNVANLSLARASAREGELAVRAALGAGQRRLMRQLITECALLGVIGTGLGVILAHLSLGTLIAIAPADLPRLESVRMDARVYAFGVLLASLGGLAIGIVPALHVGAVNVAQRLREGARGLVRG